MTPTTVAGFILLDPRFPRSIPHCVREIRHTLGDLLAHTELAHVEFPTDRIDALEALSSRTPEAVIDIGLHEFLDQVQLELIALGSQIADTFFHADSAAA